MEKQLVPDINLINMQIRILMQCLEMYSQCEISKLPRIKNRNNPGLQ